ncbi:hypothetical protein [Roseivirga thermotolerans]|uniref:hypothetical protein n=1 Tax=Roseivirga thermotolerans TaxID=1758176 RepID=UPI00273F9748|nr:hypothetical protein [Roseivirga thermotolerans]
MNKKGRHIKLEDQPELAKNIFEVPEGYFDRLNKDILEAAEREDSTLYKNEKLKTLPFEVPQNYFEELTEEIMVKTVGRERKVVPLYKQSPMRWLAVAASLVLIASFYFLSPKALPENNESGLELVSDDTIIDYLNAQQAFQNDIFSDVDSFDLILDEIIAEELNSFADLLTTNAELDYHFEYFDY